MAVLNETNFPAFLSEFDIRQPNDPRRQYKFPTEELLPGQELIAIENRAGSKGVLFFVLDELVYANTFDVAKAKLAKTNGRLPSIICDLCTTQRDGRSISLVTFLPGNNIRSQNRKGIYCCKDFQCSAHVRDLTLASQSSRVAIRETEFNKDGESIPLTTTKRIKRLKDNSLKLFDMLGVKPILGSPEVW